MSNSESVSEIIGLKAIAQEMGVSIPGLYSLIERDAFLVYKPIRLN